MLEDCECVECCNKSIDTKKFFETIQRTKKNKFEITLIDKPEMSQSVSQLQFILSRNEIEKQMMIFLDICYEWYEPYLARIKKINEQQNELFETGYSLESKKFVVGAELIYDSNGYSIHFVDEDDENIASCVDDLYYKDIVKQ
ncbi:2169_t:CDS:2, partial [Entrophospora sp. SA101]